MASRVNRGRLRLVEGTSPGRDDPGAPASTTWDARSRPADADSASRTPLPGEGTGPAPTGAAARAQIAALPDAQLVALGCKGETQALEILYRRHAAFAIHLA